MTLNSKKDKKKRSISWHKVSKRDFIKAHAPLFNLIKTWILPKHLNESMQLALLQGVAETWKITETDIKRIQHISFQELFDVDFDIKKEELSFSLYQWESYKKLTLTDRLWKVYKTVYVRHRLQNDERISDPTIKNLQVVVEWTRHQSPDRIKAFFAKSKTM